MQTIFFHGLNADKRPGFCSESVPPGRGVQGLPVPAPAARGGGTTARLHAAHVVERVRILGRVHGQLVPQWLHCKIHLHVHHNVVQASTPPAPTQPDVYFIPVLTLVRVVAVLMFLATKDQSSDLLLFHCDSSQKTRKAKRTATGGDLFCGFSSLTMSSLL